MNDQLIILVAEFFNEEIHIQTVIGALDHRAPFAANQGLDALGGEEHYHHPQRPSYAIDDANTVATSVQLVASELGQFIFDPYNMLFMVLPQYMEFVQKNYPYIEHVYTADELRTLLLHKMAETNFPSNNFARKMLAQERTAQHVPGQ